MALPITVPFTFGNATTTQSLSSLDADFSTVYNAVNGIGNGTVSLANVSITGGSISANSLSTFGNLTFTGTGNRITGDFTNATVASRVAFQTSTANSTTNVSAIPNGTGVNAVFRGYGASDPTNAPSISLAQIGTTESTIRAEANGSSSYVPMTFYTGGSERLRIDTSGNVGIGTSSPYNKLTVENSAGTSPPALGAQGGHFSLSNGTYGMLSGVTSGGNGWIQAQRTDSTATAYNLLLQPSGGNVGIGTTSPNASAILDAQSTTKGLRFPNMTTTQKNAISSPAAGLVIFDTTLSKLCVYTGAAWQTITSA